MSSHSPSQLVCVCAEKRCIDPSTDSVRESALGMLHAIYWLTFTRPGDGLSILSPSYNERDQGARPQLSARSCKRSLGNSRIRFAWGSDTRPHSPRAWTSGYSRNVCRISTSHLSTWCWWCVVGINWHSVAPTEVCKYRVLIIRR